MEGKDFSTDQPTHAWAEDARRAGLVTRRTVGVHRGKGTSEAEEASRASGDDGSEALGNSLLTCGMEATSGGRLPPR
jgi:hypothetical protein